MSNIHTFDWKAYIENYADLQNAGINTKGKAYCHWIKFGKQEGRTFKRIIREIDRDFQNKTIISQQQLFNDEMLNLIYTNIFNNLIDKNLFDRYINIHNKESFLVTIINSEKNIGKLKIGLDITPIDHRDYAIRGVGSVVRNYVDILSKNSYVDLRFLSRDTYNSNFDIIHFTCPPVLNDIWDDDKFRQMRFIRDECLKKQNSKIYVITIYDLIPHIFKDQYKPSKIYYDFMDLLDKMHLIIAISKSTKNDLINIFKISEDKIYVIYPPLRSDITNIISSQNLTSDIVLKKYGITKKFILYTGGPDFRKNIGGTIKGYSIAKKSGIDIQLVIVCKMSKGIQNMYKDLIDESFIMNDIIFTDFVPNDELGILYKCAFATIFVSLYEGFGMPIIESINYKIPVIVSNTSSMNELTELSSNNLLVADPYNVESIYNAIKYVFTMDKEEYDDYINNAYEILPLFKNDIIGMELINAYKYSLIKNNIV